MHITGGLYRELCMTPHWNALFGSGGRAALALAQVAPCLILHSYIEDPYQPELDIYRTSGIELRLQARPTPIAFAYFHPLSRPHIAPEVIAHQSALRVRGKTVLRFGLLEGEAIVTANRAVYDPQTWQNAPSFRANGSTAHTLAIVLNELELQGVSGCRDLLKAAAWIIKEQDAAVVVVKRGIKGATVFERDGRASDIPAYRSPSVFKIGTGDVFSAVFAYYWGDMLLAPPRAADLASRAVAAYCATRRLPLDRRCPDDTQRVGGDVFGPVIVAGGTDTIGRRYTMEEARYGLEELGLEVMSPGPDGEIDRKSAVAILLLGDGASHSAVALAREFAADGKPIILLCEGGARPIDPALEALGAQVVEDFTTALYFTGWAATRPQDRSFPEESAIAWR